MANEISVTTNISATKGNLSFSRSVTQSVNWNTAGKGSNTQSVATTAAGVAVTVPSGVATNGWCFVRNLDSTNFVEVGQQTGGTTFVPVVRLNAGEAALFRLSQGIALFARANTAAVQTEFAFLND